MPNRYYTLDAMRGVAALAILVLHIGDVMRLPILHHGYLAVDFFFVLSGFVLATAYEPRLKSSLTAFRFAELRMIRLYPLFFVGILLGIPVIFGQIFAGSPQAMTPGVALLAFVANVLILPAPYVASLFPFNKPAWSLVFEMAINIIFGAALFRFSARVLAMLCFLSGSFFLLSIAKDGSATAGFDWPTFVPAIFRTAFSFIFGILIARVHNRLGRTVSVLSALLPLLLIFVLQFNVPAGFDWIYDAVAVFMLLPLLTVAGSMLELPACLRGVGQFMGDLSYPLYAVHYPILQTFSFLLVRRLHLPPPEMAVLIVVTILTVAFLLSRFYDRQARAWLGKQLRDRSSAVRI